jgi:hypothetical protein
MISRARVRTIVAQQLVCPNRQLPAELAIITVWKPHLQVTSNEGQGCVACDARDDQ